MGNSQSTTGEKRRSDTEKASSKNVIALIEGVAEFVNKYRELQTRSPEFRNNDNLSTGKYSTLTLPPDLQNFWKITINSLEIGRPLGGALIVLFGYTGSGKSTTINVLFDDDKLCPTSDYKSQTRYPVIVKKTLLVPAQDSHRNSNSQPSVKGDLVLVDFPGCLDSDREKEAPNLASIRYFLKTRPEFHPRKDVAKIIPTTRSNVFPNLVLFTIKASENRLVGNNTPVFKALEVLRSTHGLVDTEHPNLIIVLTHCCSMGRNPDKYIQSMKKKFGHIRTVVREVLGILNVPIVPVENDHDSHQLPKFGDYYQLPDGTSSQYNLYQAMISRFEENRDLLGGLFVGRYFTTNCPERNDQAKLTNCGVKMEDLENELIFANQTLVDIHMCTKDELIVPTFRFQSLGYGYCPLTETVKPVCLVKGATGDGQKVVKFHGAKFIVPGCVSAYEHSESGFESVSYFTKEQYESNRTHQYGLDGSKLVLKAGAEGRWIKAEVNEAASGVISMAYEKQVATLKLENPKNNLSSADFKADLNKLPLEFNEKTAHQFAQFFSEWGSHLIHEQAIGGEVQFNCMTSIENMTEQKYKEIRGYIAGMFNLVSASAQGVSNDQMKDLQSVGVTNIKIKMSGGEIPDFINLSTLNIETLERWASKVPEKPIELTRHTKLTPYYTFFCNGKQYIALRDATGAYLKGELKAAENIRGREEASEFSNRKIFQTIKEMHVSTPVMVGIVILAGLACVAVYMQ